MALLGSDGQWGRGAQQPGHLHALLDGLVPQSRKVTGRQRARPGEWRAPP